MMIKFDSGIGVVWHNSCVLYSSIFPKGDRRLFQTLFLPSVHFVSLNKNTDTTMLQCKPKPELLLQTLRNHRPTRFLLQIINANKTISGIF